jgi:hypothetical protein
VVATIGNVAVTQADVEAEYRFELFLDGRKPEAPPDAANFAAARDRLIEQRLLAEEAAAEGVKPEGARDKAAETLAEVRKRFGNPEGFESALKAAGLDEQQAINRLLDQEKALRMIEQRFRPAAWPEPAEVEAYYRETFVPEFARRSTASPPPLSEVENQIREILVEKKIDRLLGAWLEEMKAARRVRVHEF